MPTRAAHCLLVTLVGVLFTSTSSPAFAAKKKTTKEGMRIETRITQQMQYDSNPLRVASGEEAILGSITSPQLKLSTSTPTSRFESESRLDVNTYDDSDYNSIDGHQKLLLARSNERWTSLLRAGLSVDTTRTSEPTSYAIRQPRVRSTRLMAGPEISFRASPRSNWVLGGSAANVAYNSQAYTDYRTYALAPRYDYKLDPQNTLNVSFNAQRYESTEGATSRSTSVGPSVGWTGQINPRLQLRAGAGSLHTKKYNAGVERDVWNYVFTGGADFKGARDQLSFSASRARAPFGNGTETLLDRFSLTNTHRVNEKLSLTTLAQYQSADYESEPGINLDHSSMLGAGAAYSIDDALAIKADYTYRTERLTNVSGRINQHMLWLGLTYAPSWSGE